MAQVSGSPAAFHDGSLLRELQKFGGRLSTLLFPDSFLESTLRMRAACLRSEWTNTSLVFSVSDLWMGVLTRTARFVSSHDLPKRRWITHVSPLVQQDFMSKNEFESQLFYLKRHQFSLIYNLITALPVITSTCLYGSCKSARLKRRCLDARRTGALAAVRWWWIEDGGGNRRPFEEHFDRKSGQRVPLFPLGGDFTLQCSHHYDYSRCSGQPVGHCIGLQKQKAQEGR